MKGNEVSAAIMIQAVWFLVLLASGKLLMKQALRKVVVQGADMKLYLKYASIILKPDAVQDFLFHVRNRTVLVSFTVYLGLTSCFIVFIQ